MSLGTPVAFLAQIGVQRVPSKGAWVTHSLAGSLMSGDGQGSEACLAFLRTFATRN